MISFLALIVKFIFIQKYVAYAGVYKVALPVGEVNQVGKKGRKEGRKGWNGRRREWEGNGVKEGKEKREGKREVKEKRKGRERKSI